MITYIHTGDIKPLSLPSTAPPALHFLSSYVPALDSSSHDLRKKHFSPNATITTNAGPPTEFAKMDKMFEMRDQLCESFSHVVNRVWIIEQPDGKITAFMDWSSTTVFKGKTDKPAIVPEFSVMHLEKAGEGDRGVNGLWCTGIENWMDVSPVKEVRDEINAKAGPKPE
ncbi:hypothetical protein K469DRAFT_714673 [Zopfia rhizophila CBS 207.26]|uniref:Uncharacterized protein n=1 Tax=Zopfia rhizophila CBS 207.26 TaxID=1314779 RepID=A0A6A6DNV4_9PEZI|nr:hypothetical protein K469DRAFT_714673 [Zopfia rhizophila CBS 207.26]